jgi:general stress protein 26
MALFLRCFEATEKGATMSQELAREEQIQKLAELIQDIDFAMFTTACSDGSLRSRPMSTQKTPFDGTLWFFTGFDSAKVHEIEDDQHVNLSYADPKGQTYVSVSGRARISRDRAKIHELWEPTHKAWFPEGEDDPNIALIQVEVEAAEYWDSPVSTVVHIFGFAKALATGQSYEPGENEKINL